MLLQSTEDPRPGVAPCSPPLSGQIAVPPALMVSFGERVLCAVVIWTTVLALIGILSARRVRTRRVLRVGLLNKAVLNGSSHTHHRKNAAGCTNRWRLVRACAKEALCAAPASVSRS